MKKQYEKQYDCGTCNFNGFVDACCNTKTCIDMRAREYCLIPQVSDLTPPPPPKLVTKEFYITSVLSVIVFVLFLIVLGSVIAEGSTAKKYSFIVMGSGHVQRVNCKTVKNKVIDNICTFLDGSIEVIYAVKTITECTVKLYGNEYVRLPNGSKSVVRGQKIFFITYNYFLKSTDRYTEIYFNESTWRNRYKMIKDR